jgi:hypothetical protein
MEKVLIRKIVNVQLNYDADDWDLFTSVPNVELAALALNRAFEEAVNSGKTRAEVTRIMDRQMDQYSHFGARDSEPIWVLDRLLDKTFGDR